MDVRKRKRGIRASRSKLETAMIAAGFETQAELAHKIAQVEGIEKPPKDLVSKVFREQAVSTHNLTRIANGLGVDAHTIYLSQEDDEFSQVVTTQQNYSQQYSSPQNYDQPTNKPPANGTRKQIIFAIIFLILIVSAFIYWQNKDTEIPDATAPQSLASTLGKIKIIVQAPEELKPLAEVFAKKLGQIETVSSTVANTPNSYYLSSYEALDKWQAQAVLKLGLIKGQYYQAVSAKISALDREADVLQTVISSAETRHQSSNMSQRLLSATKAFIKGDTAHFPKALDSRALAPFLRAKNIAFTAHSAVDFQSAIDYFKNALNIEAKLTEAHAGICQTKVRMSWIQEESALLEEAAQSCRQAEKLDTQNIDYKIAQAQLYSRIGELGKAIALLQPEVDDGNANADLLAALAELYLTQFGQTNEQVAIVSAQEYAKQALTFNPQHWRAYNTLGNLYFSTGDTQGAKKQFFEASKIVKHEVILANLGTLQMCFGELEQAKQTYSDVIANYTSNYIGYESLGSVYLFQQNYEQALKNKLIAIEKQPDIAIHQVWAGLAEAYWLNQQDDLAWEHYAKALTLIERDELLETISFSDQLHKVYYQRKLAIIKPQQPVPIDLSSKIETFIDKRTNLGLKARSHLAWLAGQANRPADKTLIWNEIIEACSVYKYSPELITRASLPNL